MEIKINAKLIVLSSSVILVFLLGLLLFGILFQTYRSLNSKPDYDLKPVAGSTYVCVTAYKPFLLDLECFEISPTPIPEVTQ